MNSTSNSPSGSGVRSPGKSRSPRNPPGPPTEVWLWRVVPKKGRGEHRTLADNVRVDHWEDVWNYRHPGAGRYRIEFRDARRAIVKVEYANVPDPRSTERIVYTTGRVRRPQRTVPPPSRAWEPRPEPRPAPPPRSPKPEPKAATASRPSQGGSPLRPPHEAPQGMQWRLRQKGNWELFDIHREIPKGCCELRTPAGEFILVYSPDGTWPGYVRTHLSNGRTCLVPNSTR